MQHLRQRTEHRSPIAAKYLQTDEHGYYQDIPETTAQHQVCDVEARALPLTTMPSEPSLPLTSKPTTPSRLQPSIALTPQRRVRFPMNMELTSTSDPSQSIDITTVDQPISLNTIPTTWSDYAKYLKPGKTPLPLDPTVIAIIQQHHNDFVGHHGIAATVRRLRAADQYWPTMRSDTCNFIQTCPVCQKFWSHLPKPSLAAHTLDVYEPFQCLASDWMGPFPIDEYGNEYIHVIVDAASRKVHLFPHKTQTARNASFDFLRIFGSYGVCQYVHSDNGPSYIAKLIEEFLGMIGVDHIRITPYRHESNGQVEVFNRGVLRHLRAICFSKDIANQWSYLALPIVESIVNNVPNTTTGISAMQYLYGPLFTAHRGLNTPFPGPRPLDETLRHLHKLQPLLIQASQRHQATRSDAQVSNSLNRTLTRFAIGSYVVVTYPNRPPHKLLSRYRGPFLVKDRVRDGSKESDTYICQDLPTGKVLQFHADRLREYFHPADSEGLTPLDVAARDKAEYVIDFISDHRGSARRKKDLSFKVHWLGYDDSEATWEPYKNLKDTIIAFETYCQTVPSLSSLL